MHMYVYSHICMCVCIHIYICAFLMLVDNYSVILFILYLSLLGLCCCTGFSVPVASGGYSVALVYGLLMAVNSLVADHRL